MSLLLTNGCVIICNRIFLNYECLYIFLLIDIYLACVESLELFAWSWAYVLSCYASLSKKYHLCPREHSHDVHFFILLCVWRHFRHLLSYSYNSHWSLNQKTHFTSNKAHDYLILELEINTLHSDWCMLPDTGFIASFASLMIPFIMDW